MSNPQTPVGTPRLLDQLVETAGTLGFGIFRLGIAVGTAPLALLPAQSRTDALQATNDLVSAVGKFQVGVVQALIDGINAWTRGLTKPAETAPAKPAK